MLAIFFWVLMLVWLVFGVAATRTNRDYFVLGNAFLIWVLFVMVGLQVFGFPV